MLEISWECSKYLQSILLTCWAVCDVMSYCIVTAYAQKIYVASIFYATRTCTDTLSKARPTTAGPLKITRWCLLERWPSWVTSSYQLQWIYQITMYIQWLVQIHVPALEWRLFQGRRCSFKHVITKILMETELIQWVE